MAESVSAVAVLVALASVVGGVPVVALAGGVPQVTVADGVVGAQADGDGANGSASGSANGSLAPGERLAGVVGVERAAVEGAIASRSFGHRIAAAASNQSRAAVLNETVADLQDRLAALQTERSAVERAYENGTISRGEYRARLAELQAEQRALQRLADRAGRVAEGLPREALRSRGVDVTALRTIRAEAANLTGPEVAAMAREIAGPHAGEGLGPADRGPPEFAGARAGGPAGPPGATGTETGPPDDAGNRSGPTDDPGNGTAPHDDSAEGRDALSSGRFGTF